MAANQRQYELLLDKYLRNECTDEEKAMLTRWYDSLDGQLPIPSANELDVLAQKNWFGVATRIGSQPTVNRPLWNFISSGKVAAVLVGFLLLIGISWYVYQNKPGLATLADKSTEQDGWVIRSNNTSQPLAITLPDGSLVSLKPGSQFKYSPQFGQKDRSVQLVGSAFFNVKRDPTRPFRVQTKWIAVKVLGTSFTVSAPASAKKSEVSVMTGQVEVVRRQDKTKLILTPNERVQVSEDTGPLVKSLVEQPVVINSHAITNRFDFANTPVADVFKTIEQAYNISIQFDPRILAHCTLTAPAYRSTSFYQIRYDLLLDWSHLYSRRHPNYHYWFGL